MTMTITTTDRRARSSKQAARALSVRLSVIAVSMVALALSWLGVVRADEASNAASGDATWVSAPVSTDGRTVLVPAPKADAARRPAVIRTSRAS